MSCRCAIRLEEMSLLLYCRRAAMTLLRYASHAADDAAGWLTPLLRCRYEHGWFADIYG